MAAFSARLFLLWPFCLQDEEEEGSDKDSDGKSKPLMLLFIPITVKQSVMKNLFLF